MAKYPIVVVKENPGTQDTPGKLVVAVKWLDEQSGREHVVETKLPKLIGKLRDEALVNGSQVRRSGGEYVFELGAEEVSPAEEEECSAS